MIESELQLEVTKESAKMFEEAIANYDRQKYIDKGVHEQIADAYLDSLKSMYQELIDDIEEYESK